MEWSVSQDKLFPSLSFPPFLQDLNVSLNLPVEVKTKGVQPSVLVLLQYGSVKVANLECLVQNISSHSPRVHGCVDALSSHWVNES